VPAWQPFKVKQNQLMVFLPKVNGDSISKQHSTLAVEAHFMAVPDEGPTYLYHPQTSPDCKGNSQGRSVSAFCSLPVTNRPDIITMYLASILTVACGIVHGAFGSALPLAKRADNGVYLANCVTRGTTHYSEMAYYNNARSGSQVRTSLITLL
jgi:hypothetical protein